MLKVPFFDPRLKQLDQVALNKAREFGKEIWEDGNFIPRAAFDAVLLEYLQEAGMLKSALVPTFYSDDMGYMISAEDRDRAAVEKNGKEILEKFSRPVYQVTRDILFPNITKSEAPPPPGTSPWTSPPAVSASEPLQPIASEHEAERELKDHIMDLKVPSRDDLVGHLEAIWRFLYTKMGFRAKGTGSGALMVIAQAIKYIRGY